MSDIKSSARQFIAAISTWYDAMSDGQLIMLYVIAFLVCVAAGPLLVWSLVEIRRQRRLAAQFIHRDWYQQERGDTLQRLQEDERRRIDLARASQTTKGQNQ